MSHAKREMEGFDDLKAPETIGVPGVEGLLRNSRLIRHHQHRLQQQYGNVLRNILEHPSG
jgi:hypothetical protein